MHDRLKILVLGASYGLLPGVKLALAGHEVTFVGREDEIARMQQDELVLRIPLRREAGIAQLRCSSARFTTPDRADPAAADIVLLAMQEPQLADPQVAALVQRVGAASVPCLSIMNLPPAPFLERLGISGEAVEGAYAGTDAWQGFTPGKMSNASPDPQALRMDRDKPGELTVTLASNFKAAPFADPADQQVLERAARDMSRLKVDGIAPPVRLLAHSSPFIPLVKWPMLIAGNCRCVKPDGIVTIAEAILSDPDASRAVYDAVFALVIKLGAEPEIMVPFDAYAKAAAQLTRPSSAARAIDGGAVRIERIDRLVLNLMRANRLDTSLIEPIAELIEKRLVANQSQN